MTRVAALFALGLACVAPHPLAAHPVGEHTAPPPEAERLWEPPAPGTYELPPIQAVSDARLLDPRGERAALLGLEPGEACVVGFIYRSCSDAGGCPLALATLQRLDRLLATEPELARRTRLVTVSFDPERDTPGKMGELEAALAPRTRWRFLTPASPQELAPVLADFGQEVLSELTADGEATGRLRHLLKVFLVDDQNRVRNIYSAAFLRADLLRNDLKTLFGD